MKKILNNKIVKIIYGIIKYSFFIFLVLYLLFTAYQKFVKTDIKGYRIYTVVTGSMKPVYDVGDVILIKKQKEYKVGDIVSYEATVLDNDSSITHRIVSINNDKVVTKGDANDVEDEPITKDKIQGKVIAELYLFSMLTKLMRNKYLFYFIIFVPLVVMIFMEVADSILSKTKDDEDEE